MAVVDIMLRTENCAHTARRLVRWLAVVLEFFVQQFKKWFPPWGSLGVLAALIRCSMTGKVKVDKLPLLSAMIRLRLSAYRLSAKNPAMPRVAASRKHGLMGEICRSYSIVSFVSIYSRFDILNRLVFYNSIMATELEEVKKTKSDKDWCDASKANTFLGL